MRNTLPFSVKTSSQILVARCLCAHDAAALVRNYTPGATVLVNGRVIYTLPPDFYDVEAIRQAIHEAAGQWRVPKKRTRATAKVKGGAA